MTQVYSPKNPPSSNNYCISKTISLQEDITAHLLIESADHKLGDFLYNSIIDVMVDKISVQKTYHDFSIALEWVNSLLKTWQLDKEKIQDLDVIISICQNQNIMFSQIGRASCILVQANQNVSTLTGDGAKTPHEFDFISNGTIAENDMLIFCTKNIMLELSENDLIDSYIHASDSQDRIESIHAILQNDSQTTNYVLSSIEYSWEKIARSIHPVFEFTQQMWLKIMDHPYTKILIQKLITLQNKVLSQDKKTKNIIFLVWIILCLFVLYRILGGIVEISSNDQDSTQAKTNITQASTYLRIASENLGNKSIFDINIQEAENIVWEVSKQWIFLSDLEKLQNDIAILKQEFNKVSIFKPNLGSTLYKEEIKSPINILRTNGEIYIIQERSVIGPIIEWEKPNIYTLSSLENDEIFLHADVIANEIHILTSFGKVVRFAKERLLEYVDVSGQDTWNNGSEIKWYAQNLYLLDSENNNIIRHAWSGSGFKSGSAYLKDEDSDSLWNILSIAIDGGFYILKEDLSIVKFFANPSYRLESLVINNLPENYNREPNSQVDIKARSDLNYVYMLLNNNIWIFSTNSKNYTNTQSLNYIGQISWWSDKIIDFYVNIDGEIFTIQENGVYKIRFEVSDNNIILR